MTTWIYNQKAFSRQKRTWRRFLPYNRNDTWTASSLNPSYGIPDERNPDDGTIDNEAIEETKANFEDFLTCLATHLPHNFFHTVMQESTSFNWVVNKSTRPSI